MNDINKEIHDIEEWFKDSLIIFTRHKFGFYNDNDEVWINYLSESEIKKNRLKELQKMRERTNK